MIIIIILKHLEVVGCIDWKSTKSYVLLLLLFIPVLQLLGILISINNIIWNDLIDDLVLSISVFEYENYTVNDAIQNILTEIKLQNILSMQGA